jgi:hypothetical protein
MGGDEITEEGISCSSAVWAVDEGSKRLCEDSQ